ncbi:MAG: RNA polymerase sigma-70 factor [Rikenellaceae bacterium]
MVERTKILEDVKSGSEQAFQSLFCGYYTDLVAYAYRFVKDIETSEDIVQEFFINFWFKKKFEDIHSSVESYMFHSVKNACLNYIRNEKNRNNKHNEMMKGIDLCYDKLDIEEEDFEKIYKAIHRLPERRKRIFMLCCFNNLKYHEVAEKLNISINTVRTQMGRALKSLRKYLNANSSNLFISIFLLFPVIL